MCQPQQESENSVSRLVLAFTTEWSVLLLISFIQCFSPHKVLKKQLKFSPPSSLPLLGLCPDDKLHADFLHLTVAVVRNWWSLLQSSWRKTFFAAVQFPFLFIRQMHWSAIKISKIASINFDFFFWFDLIITLSAYFIFKTQIHGSSSTPKWP